MGELELKKTPFPTTEDGSAGRWNCIDLTLSYMTAACNQTSNWQPREAKKKTGLKKLSIRYDLQAILQQNVCFEIQS